MVEVLDAPLLRALTEPARLAILRVLLIHGPADIATIAEQLPQDRSVISRHLKVLEDAGVVLGVREGRHNRYHLDGAGFVAELERILGETRALAAICCPPVAEIIPAARLRRATRPPGKPG